jgi:hypothetical protein
LDFRAGYQRYERFAREVDGVWSRLRDWRIELGREVTTLPLSKPTPMGNVAHRRHVGIEQPRLLTFFTSQAAFVFAIIPGFVGRAYDLAIRDSVRDDRGDGRAYDGTCSRSNGGGDRHC